MMLKEDAKRAILAELWRRVGATGTMSIADRLLFRMEMVREYRFRSPAAPDQLIATWIENFFDQRLPP